MGPQSKLQQKNGTTTPPSPSVHESAEATGNLQLKESVRQASGYAQQAAMLSPVQAKGYAQQAAMLSPVQAKGATGNDVHDLAASGTAGSGETLPFYDQIQSSFGRHDVSHIKAYTGGAAQAASEGMGAEAYATGSKVAFGKSPTLHTAAHEAAHIIQQQGGVSLKGGVGEVGDQYERHADAVADLVVQGKSAEPLLDRLTGGGKQVGGRQKVSNKSAVGQALQFRRNLQRRDDNAGLRQARSTAASNLRKWYDAAAERIAHTRQWQSNNWDDYTSRTGGDYYLAWTTGQMENLIWSTAGTVTGVIAEKGAIMLGTAAGTAIAPGIGTAIGAVFGFLVSAIAGAISANTARKEGMANLDASHRAASTDRIAKNDTFFEEERNATRKLAITREERLSSVESETDIQSINETSERARQELEQLQSSTVDTGDRSTAEGMLAAWSLQRAGDARRGNSQTNETSYAQNREDFLKVAKGADVAQKDLFIHQSKFEWSSLAIDWQTPTKRMASDYEANSSEDAAKVKDRFDGRPFALGHSSEPETTISKIKRDYYNSGGILAWLFSSEDGSMCRDAEEQIRKNDFSLVGRLKLASSGRSVYVKNYRYSIDLKREMPRGYKRTGDWTVSPR